MEIYLYVVKLLGKMRPWLSQHSFPLVFFSSFLWLYCYSFCLSCFFPLIITCQILLVFNILSTYSRIYPDFSVISLYTIIYHIIPFVRLSCCRWFIYFYCYCLKDRDHKALIFIASEPLAKDREYIQLLIHFYWIIFWLKVTYKIIKPLK